MDRGTARLSLLLIFLLLVACGPAGGTPEPGSTPLPPSATANLLPVDTVTPTATTLPSGPCDNLLMSLRVGNQWKYQAVSPVGTSQQILRVVRWDESQGLNAVIQVENLKTGTITSDPVTCMDGGGIEDFPLFFISMQMGDYMDGMFNTYYQSGVYSPAYAQFVTNQFQLEWGAEYLTEDMVCFVQVLDTGSLCITRSSPIELSFQTVGEYEPVSVPAGDFPQALKVTFTIRMSSTLIYPAIATSAPLTVRITQWYAPFIGLVRSEVASASVELVSGQSSTVPVESVIELIEFSINP